ncbi:oligosaccharide repeat unit polymerase [Modestobacter roseus]|uniref:Oligosaccharide repeat unit polymerase n=1 Tax=Modestobacter roseus TaxID=1181884 RepID=A0A562IWL2_9ACTN|nr:oligosaccharide repeat unit polymerase [Modestobacter roseus]MQA33998.1 oligosaccharide repeat unit polymerase [Modestobacter roseus]TWH75357.1 oligosaccharide repeat unit polymerase [Modestobacter roseus]
MTASLRARVSRPPDVGQRVGVWWLNPVALIGMVALPTTWLAYAIPDDRYRALWRTPKVLTLDWTLWFTVGLLLFIGGALLPAARGRARRVPDWPALSPADLRLLGRAATVTFWLVMVGYVAFLLAGARAGISPSVLVDILVDQELYGVGLRETLGTVPGLTTMTQFGVAFAVVTGVLMVADPASRPRHLRRLAVVFFLALCRAFFLSERLALLELLVPLIVVLVAGLSRSSTGARRASFLPAVLLPLVVAVFAAFEYSRSWVFYKAQGGQSFPTFVVERFAGYYVTAYNNGEIRLLHQTDASLPYDLLSAFWTAPGVGSLNLFRTLTGVDQESSYTDALTTFGNPEFNNTGGVVSPFVDLGLLGGLVFFLLAGLACGLLYRSLQEGRTWGLLLYPLVVLTLFELPRYLYLFQGRATPGLIALVTVALLVHRNRRRRTGARL